MGAATFTNQAPLPAVPVELRTIAGGLWPGQVYLNDTFTAATLVEARQANAYPIVHLATHGEFRNGPLGDSYIQFWDQRLGLDQMAQLRLNEPPLELLVLSACRTALGGETAELGFAGLAVKAGVKSALASLWQVSDAGTAGFMVAFYSSLRSAPFKAQALQQAQLAMLRGEVSQNRSQGTLQWAGGVVPMPPEALTGEDLRHPYYWAAFTLVGNPW
jgi:CHAT domain-containing protein